MPLTLSQTMKVAITDKLIRQITPATLIVAILCIPGRADPMVDTSGDPRGDPTGACCLFDGSCIVVTEAECQTKDGIYQGDDVTCEDAVCARLGACCIPFDICVVSTIQECFGELGGIIWAPEQDCVSYTCPPLGACCELDGTCRVTAEYSCDISFGAYQGDGVLCKDSSCAQPCPADFDGDGIVNTVDLLILFGAWGPNPGHPADLDGDGIVTTADLLILFSNWGQCK